MPSKTTTWIIHLLMSVRLHFCILVVWLFKTGIIVAQSIYYEEELYCFDTTQGYHNPLHSVASQPQLYSFRLIETVPARDKWLEVSGDISYQYFTRQANSEDFFLLSAENHLAHMRLSVVYRETYPFSVDVRFNRSLPFQTDNLYEFQFGFDKEVFRRMLLDKQRKKLESQMMRQYLQLKQEFSQQYRNWQKEKQKFSGAAGVQQAVEERIRAAKGIHSERIGRGIGADTSILSQLQDLLDKDLPGMDSLKSKLNGWKKTGEGLLLNREDSLLAGFYQTRDKILGLRGEFSSKLDSIAYRISQAKNNMELNELLSDIEMDSLKARKPAFSRLMNTNLRAGKFLANLSELTVNNIFLHGASIRYGDKYFVEGTAGVYDFAFRQLFQFRNDTARGARPFVMALRMGKETERQWQAITIYAGKKNRSLSLDNSLRQVAGISYERRWRMGLNWQASMELAKSTVRPLSASDKEGNTWQELLGNFKKETLAAFGSLQGRVERTATEVDLSYRYWGQQFESFNATQFFNPQSQWNARLRQPFLKKILQISLGVRYSDFRNAGIGSNLRNRTLFTSSNGILRIKKIPVISVGYYPGSQLYWMEGNKLYEYHYSIMNVTVSHHFTAAGMPMQTTASYNRFTHAYRDSLVAPARGMASIFWTTWKNAFTFSLNASRQRTDASQLATLEAGTAFAGRVLRLGGSIKWNQLGHETRWGYSCNAGLALGKWGTINLLFDQSYLPDREGLFLPVQMGQVQYTKPLNFTIWR